VGQKVSPIGLRLKINKTWDSKWFSSRDFSANLNEDILIRKYVKKNYFDAAISKVEIERAAKMLVLKIYTARPGKLIGKQGKGIDSIRMDISKLVKDNASEKTIKVDVFEVKSPEGNAQLSAYNIAQQLEKRVSFRRAMKKVMQQAMKSGVRGIKVRVSGRLNGAEMARTEWYMEGRVPLHTLRADIDYATAEASTTYGLIGVKVWLFKGEVFNRQMTNKSTEE